MFIRRTAAASLAAALTFGGASLAHAADASTITDPTTSTTEPAAPVIDAFTLELPGLGSIDVSVDTTTGQITTILVTPVDGVTASDPTVVNGGVQIDFTLTDGSTRSIIVSAETEHGRVEIEIDDPSTEGPDVHHGDGPPPIADRGESEDHRNDGDHRDEHSEGRSEDESDDESPDVTTPTTTDTTVGPMMGSGRGADRSGSHDSDHSEDSGAGRRD